ncbi:MAG TPA: Lrp/AsnC family transcriptional regulator [Anaerolineae bacterium]|nr:Lrp/AsnC family transcriptional regulator [Anaerolineae bacterium]
MNTFSVPSDANVTPSPIKLDDIDLEIIVTLKRDGRTPFAQIAQRLGVSTGMIRQRYQRLLREGVLQVVAVTNPLLLGFSTMAMIGIKVEGARLNDVAEKVAALEEVIYLVLTAGAYDLFAEVVFRDNAHLLDFLTQRLRTINGIRETETFMYLKIVKEIYSWPDTTNNEQRITNNG